jgi:hypothetical protein
VASNEWIAVRETHFAIAHDPCQLAWPVNEIFLLKRALKRLHQTPAGLFGR